MEKEIHRGHLIKFRFLSSDLFEFGVNYSTAFPSAFIHVHPWLNNSSDSKTFKDSFIFKGQLIKREDLNPSFINDSGYISVPRCLRVSSIGYHARFHA